MPVLSLKTMIHVIAFISVTDGQYNKSSTEQKFSIRLIPINNMPPQFGTASPRIKVSQGGSVPVGQSELHITDPDTPVSELTMTIQETPSHGRIEKVQEGLKVTLRTGKHVVQKCVLYIIA